ncbi:hypothetical protein Agub_g7142, partial [Astrephomene gubernaculifera]
FFCYPCTCFALMSNYHSSIPVDCCCVGRLSNPPPCPVLSCSALPRRICPNLQFHLACFPSDHFHSPFAAGLPANIGFVGCYAEDSDARVVSTCITVHRPMSLERCTTLAASMPGSHLIFFALQRAYCYGASSLPAAFEKSRLLDSQCDYSCSTGSVQKCGSTSNTAAVAAYRLLV